MDIIDKFKPSGSRGRPFLITFPPFGWLLLYSHHNSECFYKSVLISLFMFVMVWAIVNMLTHIYPKLL